jgi:phage-related protein
VPRFRVVLFREDDGSAPLLDWLDSLSERARDKCTERIERLRELGHLLRRPEADYLRDGIYELRVKDQRVNYRILYFFHGREAVVLSHGVVKQAAIVSPREIERAIRRMRAYQRDPVRHAVEMS